MHHLLHGERYSNLCSYVITAAALVAMRISSPHFTPSRNMVTCSMSKCIMA